MICNNSSIFSMLEILLKFLRLLDCPGVVMTNDENNIMHNIIRTEDIKEPLEVVGKILKKIYK